MSFCTMVCRLDGMTWDVSWARSIQRPQRVHSWWETPRSVRRIFQTYFSAEVMSPNSLVLLLLHCRIMGCWSSRQSESAACRVRPGRVSPTSCGRASSGRTRLRLDGRCLDSDFWMNHASNYGHIRYSFCGTYFWWLNGGWSNFVTVTQVVELCDGKPSGPGLMGRY